MRCRVRASPQSALRRPCPRAPSRPQTSPLPGVRRYYFVCGQPGHCSAGQKVKVVVTMGSPPPPPASPPPEHPPAPPMSPRYIWPSPSPPPPANPPAAPCEDNPEYEDEGLRCEDWVGKDCYEDVEKQKSEGSLSATFDLNRVNPSPDPSPSPSPGPSPDRNLILALILALTRQP